MVEAISNFVVVVLGGMGRYWHLMGGANDLVYESVRVEALLTVCLDCHIGATQFYKMFSFPRTSLSSAVSTPSEAGEKQNVRYLASKSSTLVEFLKFPHNLSRWSHLAG